MYDTKPSSPFVTITLDNVLSDKTNRFSRSKEFVYYNKKDMEKIRRKP